MTLNLQQTQGNKIQLQTIFSQKKKKKLQTILVTKNRASCCPLITENNIGLQRAFQALQRY